MAHRLLPAALPANAPVFGLDLGEKTIGVAASDRSLTIASPLQLIRKTQFTRDAEALFGLMADRGAEGLVIGLPVNMDGTEGPRCQSVRAFARNLLRLRELPIAFWDERLSSAAVNRVLIDRDFEAGDEPVKVCVRDGVPIELRKRLAGGLRYDSIGERLDFFSTEKNAPGFVRLFSPARTPDEPLKGSRKKLFGLFLVAGIAMALIIPIGIDFSDSPDF